MEWLWATVRIGRVVTYTSDSSSATQEAPPAPPDCASLACSAQYPARVSRPLAQFATTQVREVERPRCMALCPCLRVGVRRACGLPPVFRVGKRSGRCTGCAIEILARFNRFGNPVKA